MSASLAFSFAGVVLAVLAAPSMPGIETRLLRHHFEVGVRYDDAAVAVTGSHCLADDWSVVFDWGDGSGFQTPTKRDVSQVPCANSGCVPPGSSYTLWTAHVFDRAGRFATRIEPRIHCVGAHGGAVPYPAAFEVSVYGRIPVHAMQLGRANLRVGESTELRIQLTAPAPPSGTRVFLRRGPEALREAIELPAFVDVPHHATDQKVELVARGPAAQVWIEVSTMPTSRIKRTLRIRAR
jgi:hypothetical protein